ncbi:hypothetical protein, partial [Paenibacillus xylanexedens]|uniref:hypothetical protein n=1 Tax=Paenibacillus xylanexedens TaxID=528191 RepID=UPI001C92DEAA
MDSGMGIELGCRKDRKRVGEAIVLGIKHGRNGGIMKGIGGRNMACKRYKEKMCVAEGGGVGS